MLKILGEEWLGQGKGQSESFNNDDREAVVNEQSRQEMAPPLHNRATVLTDLETEPPLLHQECAGEETTLRNELGAEDIVGGEAQL